MKMQILRSNREQGDRLAADRGRQRHTPQTRVYELWQAVYDL
jgi:hypothetical protein